MVSQSSHHHLQLLQIMSRIEGLSSSTSSREGRSSGGCQAERGGSSKQCQVARRTVPRPRDGRQFCAIQVCLQFIQCDGDPHRPSRFECQVEPSFQSDVAEWHRSISAKYGLRGIRGEASHPGPVSRATSRTQMDSDSDAPW